MKWFISHQSALEFWRKPYASEALANHRPQTTTAPAKPGDTRGLDAEERLRLSRPLHVLVGGAGARKASKRIVSHISSGRHPGGSFIQAADGLLVGSPELCFVQMASQLDLVGLVALGYELCGAYRLDSLGEPERGFRDEAPVTSVAKLSAFIARAGGLKGRTQAARALRHIIDGSASPMETVLAMLLTLPHRLGGYGLPHPLLNQEVSMAAAAGQAGRLRLFCDLYWPEARVDVEYDSDAFHSGSERIARDAIRRNALVAGQVTVLTVSRAQVASTAELRQVAVVLSRLLRRRLRLPGTFGARHAELRRQLLPRVNAGW